MEPEHPSVFVRPMTLNDIPRIHEIETFCFARPWSQESFVQELTTNRCARYLVLTDGGVIAAYGGMWLIIGEAHVNNLAVHPDYRRRGYGRRVMKELMRTAWRAGEIVEMSLEVRVTNVPAIDLYMSMGFAIEGRRPKYYEDNNEDAYIMWCRNTIENLI